MIFNSIDGQSNSDICINTYGSLDYFVKLLNDNNAEPETDPVTGQQFSWDNMIVINQTTSQLINLNNIKFATWGNFWRNRFNPVPVNPYAPMYKDTLSTYYTATSAGETSVTLVTLQGKEIVQIEKEIKPLKPSEFTFDSVTGVITLVGSSLEIGESLFIIYKKTVVL